MKKHRSLRMLVAAVLMAAHVVGTSAELKPNSADIGFKYNLPNMSVVVSPGGSPGKPAGCPAGQNWDIVVGGCTPAVTLRTEPDTAACSCTCPDQGTCTAQQTGSHPVLGWRVPPSGQEIIAGNGATTWGACTETSNACYASTPPPTTPPPSNGLGACVEKYDGEDYFRNNGRTGSYTFGDGGVQYNGVTVWGNIAPVMNQRDTPQPYGEIQKYLDAHQNDPSMWTYGTDGGIYYPYNMVATTVGADSSYDYWWYGGLCVIKRPG